MKAELKFALVILAFCQTYSHIVFAQGVGSHITLSMDSGIQTSAYTFQFGLYALSDGDTTSDLRANSFAFGINYDTLILHAGDSIITSFLPGTSDFIPPLGSFNFPTAVSKNHIRLVEQPYAGGNTGNTMIIGTHYRVGRFQFQCATGWVNGSNPTFTLQDSVIAGKTACAAVVWKDTSSSVTGFSTRGIGDGEIGLVVNINQILSSVDELIDKQQIELYPNPASQSFVIRNWSLGKEGSVEIYNVFGDQALSPLFWRGVGAEAVDISHLVSGVYFVKIVTKEGVVVRKLIKSAN